MFPIQRCFLFVRNRKSFGIESRIRVSILYEISEAYKYRHSQPTRHPHTFTTPFRTITNSPPKVLTTHRRKNGTCRRRKPHVNETLIHQPCRRHEDVAGNPKAFVSGDLLLFGFPQLLLVRYKKSQRNQCEYTRSHFRFKHFWVQHVFYAKTRNV
ncbi:hypothetical protein HanPSC8_Chr02g0069571 [Helianthus annuus]|nr:hypothetical protein HanPSC8_Chr02g0069571 [Helianthus annuus]